VKQAVVPLVVGPQTTAPITQVEPQTIGDLAHMSAQKQLALKLFDSDPLVGALVPKQVTIVPAQEVVALVPRQVTIVPSHVASVFTQPVVALPAKQEHRAAAQVVVALVPKQVVIVPVQVVKPSKQVTIVPAQPVVALPERHVANPSTLATVWLWLSSAIVRLRLALPKLVNVAEPVASPQIQRVGSDVAVVAMLTLPEPFTPVTEPVTAPVRLIDLPVAQVVAVSALPVTLPVTGAHTLAKFTVSPVPTD